MSSIREMLTKWKVDVNHEGLDRLEGQLEGIKHRLDFLAAAEVAKGLYELVERFSKMAEQLHLASESAGLTVEQMQKLNFAAEQSGVSAEAMQTSMFRLSRQLYAAKTGSEEAQKAFNRLGISPDQVKTFGNSRDALLAIADRMKNIKDPIERSALSMQLMGRGARDMVGFLKQGSAAIEDTGNKLEKMGGVLSGKQIEALVSVEHALGRFWALLKGIAGTIAAQVAPVLELMIDDFIKFFQANRELIQTNVTTWLGDVAFAFGFLWETTKYGISLLVKLAEKFGFQDRILETLAAIVSFIGGLYILKGVFSVIGGIMGTVKDAWEVLKTAWLIGSKLVTFAIEGLQIAWEVLMFAFEIGEAIISAPFIAIAALVAGAIVAIHDLWVLLSGGKIEDTWIGKLVAWIADLMDKFDVINKVKSFFSTDNLPEGVKNVGGEIINKGSDFLSGAVDFGKSLLPGSSSSEANNAVDINAPVTINVPAGTNPDAVGKSVQAGIKDHLDGLMREAKRSLTPAVAH